MNCGYQPLYLHNNSTEMTGGPEVNTHVFPRRKLIYKKSIKRLQFYCKVEMTRNTIYMPLTFKDNINAMQVNTTQNLNKHLYKSSRVAVLHCSCWKFWIAHFVPHRIMVSSLEYRAAIDPQPTHARW